MKSDGKGEKAEKTADKSAKNKKEESHKGKDKGAEEVSAKPAKQEKSAKKGKNVLQKAKEALDPGKGVSDELKDVKDRLLRLQADFENFRKRTQREKTELYKMANEDLLVELLPVLDHMELALNAAKENGSEDSFVKGVQLVADQMNGALGKFGLASIDAAGDEFDHNVHEAVSKLPSPDVAENMVLNQVRKGYMLGDKLLRAAQVVVSSGPEG